MGNLISLKAIEQLPMLYPGCIEIRDDLWILCSIDATELLPGGFHVCLGPRITLNSALKGPESFLFSCNILCSLLGCCLFSFALNHCISNYLIKPMLLNPGLNSLVNMPDAE
jgi:hypothetical protein